MSTSWAELNDFSMYEGSTPCVVCKASSSKTLLGDHWKCSKCAHVFNKDSSELKIKCYCKLCSSKEGNPINQEAVLDNLVQKVKRLKNKHQKLKKK